MARRSAAESLKLRHQIFELHAQGKSHVDIARELKVAYNTVDNHVKAAYKEITTPLVEDEFNRTLCLLKQTLKVAVERYLRTTDPADHVPVKTFLDQLIKLQGLNAPDKIDVTHTEVTQEDLQIIDMLNVERAKNASMEDELRAMVEGS